MKTVMLMLVIACSKNNFIYESKYKNDIKYYFNNLDKLDECNIPYVIEKAEEDMKALFLYIYLLGMYPYNQQLKSNLHLLKNIDNLIEYLYNNSEFETLGILYSRGVEGYIETDINKVIEYCNKATEMGNSDTAYYLGYLYNYGKGGKLEPNIDKAIEYYNKAIDMGNSNAAYNLGSLYKKGIEGHLKPNIEKAIEYYTKAMDMGSFSAARNLGVLYHFGKKEHFEPNVAKAIEYYTKAISMGSSDAAFNLGVLYKDGIKGQLGPNANKAIEYYSKAIDMGNFNAACNLGLLHERGIEGQLGPNANKAIEYYTKAIDMRIPNAAFNLGLLYKKGIKEQLEPNINKAIEWYIKAIDMGSFHAAYNLGILYNNGIQGELEPNIDKAIVYFHKAKQMGCDISSINLNDLYNNLVEEKLNISMNEVVKCLFDLYNKYNYKHNNINEIFILDNNQEEDSNNNIHLMETYLNNIKECYGVLLGQKIANDSNSTISSFKHNSINNDLFVSYSYICNYLESLLELLTYFDKHSFMIDCIQLKDRSKFNNNEDDYVNIISIKDNEYICLDENEGYKELADILSKKEQLLGHINGVKSIINNDDLYKALNEIINIERQLHEILIYTSSLRNINFINKYEALFNNN